MDNLIERLEDVIRTHLLGEMPPDPSGRLAAEPLPDLLMSYETSRSKFIAPQPRRCHVSRELQASPKAAEYKTTLSAISRKIEAGDDLRSHLSKSVGNARARDRMLADLGVHHLHLSTTLELDGQFVERGKDLLFGAFRPEDVYLIGIYEHVTDWAREDIIATVARNWPEAGIVHELSSVVGFTQRWTDEERLELQKAGIASGTAAVDGKAFMTLGQSPSGEPYSAQQLRMVVMCMPDDWRDHLDERLVEAARAVDAAAGRDVTCDWEPTVHNGCAGLVRDGVFYGIVRL